METILKKNNLGARALQETKAYKAPSIKTV